MWCSNPLTRIQVIQTLFILPVTVTGDGVVIPSRGFRSFRQKFHNVVRVIFNRCSNPLTRIQVIQTIIPWIRCGFSSCVVIPSRGFRSFRPPLACASDRPISVVIPSRGFRSFRPREKALSYSVACVSSNPLTRIQVIQTNPQHLENEEHVYFVVIPSRGFRSFRRYISISLHRLVRCSNPLTRIQVIQTTTQTIADLHYRYL